MDADLVQGDRSGGELAALGVDVAHKDRAARIWCENATMLTDTRWEYVKVPQTQFGKLQPEDFGELLTLA